MSKKRNNGSGIGGVNNGNNGNCGSNGSTNGNANGNNTKCCAKTNISITAKSANQKLLLQSIKDNLVTIVAGPPGTGKTKLSVVCGLKEFVWGKYNKLIFTRPCVEANGENLGFLPGDLNEKIRPYMYPIFDFLGEYLTQKQIEGYIKSESIVTLPLAFQRGSTFSNAFVILDEAQNTNIGQVKMFLTRIGANCKVVITGDPNQSDIRGPNGLVDAIKRLEGVTGLGIVRFDREDIMRSPIVAEIEDRYSEEK